MLLADTFEFTWKFCNKNTSTASMDISVIDLHVTPFFFFTFAGHNTTNKHWIFCLLLSRRNSLLLFILPRCYFFLNLFLIQVQSSEDTSIRTQHSKHTRKCVRKKQIAVPSFPPTMGLIMNEIPLCIRPRFFS